jgi:serine/threonine protein kinase
MSYVDTSKDEESLYLYLESILGGGLHLHIQQTNGFSLGLCRLYVTQLISAVCYLAERGVIHRDLKANNILLTPQGRLKICDFGSAKQLFPAENFDSIRSGGPALCPKTLTVIGTSHVMAPEMICRSKEIGATVEGYDLTVDWWAIGVLLLEMLYGEIPAATHLEALHSLSLETVLAPTEATLDLWTMCGHSLEDLPLQGTVAGVSSAPQPQGTTEELSALGEALQRFLCVSLPHRWSFWTLEEILSHGFFQGVDWSEVRAGRVSEVEIDRRLGYLEILEAEGTGGGGETISETDQALFAGF